MRCRASPRRVPHPFGLFANGWVRSSPLRFHPRRTRGTQTVIPSVARDPSSRISSGCPILSRCLRMGGCALTLLRFSSSSLGTRPRSHPERACRAKDLDHRVLSQKSPATVPLPLCVVCTKEGAAVRFCFSLHNASPAVPFSFLGTRPLILGPFSTFDPVLDQAFTAIPRPPPRSSLDTRASPSNAD